MASTFGVVLILLGGFIMAISYPRPPVSVSPQSRYYAFGVFGFYIGAISAALGTIILVGPSLARSLGKLRGTGSDAEQ